MATAIASFIIAAVAVGLLFTRHETPGTGLARISIPALEKLRTNGAPRVSPNGRRFSTVGVGPEGGSTRLSLVSIDSLAAATIPATEGSNFTSWSTDDRYVAFFQGGKLKKVEFGTSSVQTLCDASAADRRGIVMESSFSHRTSPEASRACPKQEVYPHH